MKTIIIGDIHGCYREFLVLLEKTKLNEEKDRLILLGDTMDRGPDSCAVLRHILKLRNTMEKRLVYLMGNHEDMALKAYLSGDREHWDRNGGAKTRESFFAAEDDIKRYDEYLSHLPLYYETEAYICAHAGISLKGLKFTARNTFLWDRGIAYGEPYDGKLFIYGHTPMKAVTYQSGEGRREEIRQRRRNPMPASGSICLDMGCVYGGSLSAMVIKEHIYQIVSVAAEK